MTISKEAIEAAKTAYWHEAHNGGGYSDKCYEAALTAAIPFLPIAVEGKERVAKLTRYDPVCSASKPDMRPNMYGEYLYIDDVLTALSEPNKPGIDSGRFEEWSLSDIIGQCRMQSREQLDPEFAQFMAEVAKRLSALISSPGKDGGQEVEAVKTNAAVYAKLVAFLGKVQGVSLGVAMSGKDHPNPDGALMELFNEAQELYQEHLSAPQPASTALVEAERRATGNGMAIAAAIIMRTWGKETYAREILNAAGYSSASKLKADGVEQYDIEALAPIFSGALSSSQSTSREGESR